MAVRKTILMYRDREMLLTGQHSKWNYGSRKYNYTTMKV
jgi:hypothetical protein